MVDLDLSDFEVGGTGGAGGAPCILQSILDELDEDQREKALAAMVAPAAVVGRQRKYRFSGERIAGVLGSWGHPVSDSAVDRHRRGGCGCAR